MHYMHTECTVICSFPLITYCYFIQFVLFLLYSKNDCSSLLGSVSCIYTLPLLENYCDVSMYSIEGYAYHRVRNTCLFSHAFKQESRD